jgi:hypothetical protein
MLSPVLDNKYFHRENLRKNEHDREHIRYNHDNIIFQMAAILEFKMAAVRGISRLGHNRFMTPMGGSTTLASFMLSH